MPKSYVRGGIVGGLLLLAGLMVIATGVEAKEPEGVVYSSCNNLDDMMTIFEGQRSVESATEFAPQSVIDNCEPHSLPVTKKRRETMTPITDRVVDFKGIEIQLFEVNYQGKTFYVLVGYPEG